jgi:hypothetical protein
LIQQVKEIDLQEVLVEQVDLSEEDKVEEDLEIMIEETQQSTLVKMINSPRKVQLQALLVKRYNSDLNKRILFIISSYLI